MSVQGLENGHCTIKGDCPRTREWSLHNLGVIVQGLDNGHWTIMDDCPGTRERSLHKDDYLGTREWLMHD